MFEELWELAQEGLGVLTSSQDVQKRKIKICGILLLVFGGMTLGISMTYTILSSAKIYDMNVIMFTAITGSVLSIITGVISACIRQSTYKREIIMAAVVFILTVTDILYQLALIGVAIPFSLRQADLFMGRDGGYGTATFVMVVALITLVAGEVIICSCVLYFVWRLPELGVVFSYIRLKLKI